MEGGRGFDNLREGRRGFNNLREGEVLLWAAEGGSSWH